MLHRVFIPDIHNMAMVRKRMVNRARHTPGPIQVRRSSLTPVHLMKERQYSHWPLVLELLSLRSH